MASPECQGRTILRSIEIVKAPTPYTTIPHGTVRHYDLDKILPVPHTLAFHGDIRQLPRTNLYMPLQVKLVWFDGTTQSLALVYRGISGMRRDVLFADGPGMSLVVKLEADSILALPHDGRWRSNKNEMDKAHVLHDLIPKVYGLWDFRIGYTRCSALVLQRVSSIVPAFFKDLMLQPLTADLLLGALDVLTNILKQMCAYAGPEHQFRLDDWHAHHLGIEQKHVYLLDWVATEYRPDLTEYQRIKRAMKSFLRIPDLEGSEESLSLSQDASRTDWMRVLGQIWQYLRGMWWPRFHDQLLPTTEQLDDLTVELTVKLTTSPIWMCDRLNRNALHGCINACRSDLQAAKKGVKLDAREKRARVEAVICGLTASGLERMRQREQLQKHLAHLWQQLEALYARAMADFASDVTMSRQEESSAFPDAEPGACPKKKVDTGVKVTEGHPTVERTCERRQWVSRASHKAREGEEGCTSQRKGETVKKAAKVKKDVHHDAVLMVSRESRAKRPRVEDKAEKGGRVKEEGAPAVESIRERRQLMPMVCHETCDEDVHLKRMLKKVEKEAITSKIRRGMKAELKQLLREDKERIVLYARLVLRKGSMAKKSLIEPVHSLGGSFFEVIFWGSFSRWKINEMKSITAKHLFVVVEKVLKKRLAGI